MKPSQLVAQLLDETEPVLLDEDMKQAICDLAKMLKAAGKDPRTVLTAGALAMALGTSGCASTYQSPGLYPGRDMAKALRGIASYSAPPKSVAAEPVAEPSE